MKIIEAYSPRWQEAEALVVARPEPPLAAIGDMFFAHGAPSNRCDAPAADVQGAPTAAELIALRTRVLQIHSGRMRPAGNAAFNPTKAVKDSVNSFG
jgi:hypothetical protein